MQLDPIVDRLVSCCTEMFSAGKACTVREMPGAAEALVTWAVCRAFRRDVFWILDGAKSLETAHRDLLALLSSSEGAEERLFYYPSWETVPADDTRQDPDITGHRLKVLAGLSEPSASRTAPVIVATCVQALMQKTIPASSLLEKTTFLKTGEEIELDVVVTGLEGSAYDFEPEVLEKGQAAVRGGIIDLWPPTETWPVRIELAGPVVESIRSFDPASQKSVRRLETVAIPPGTEWRMLRRGGRGAVSFLSHVCDDAVFIWSDADSIREHAAAYSEAIEESGAGGLTLSFEGLRSAAGRRKGSRQLFVGSGPSGAAGGELPDFQPVQGVFDMPRQVLHPDIMEGARKKLLEDLCARAHGGRTVLALLDTQGSLEHFTDSISSLPGQPDGKCPILTGVGALSEGFVSEELDVIIVAEPDLFGRRKMLDRRYDPCAERKPDTAAGARIRDLTEIEPGDHVVHVEHGIGRYLGLYEIELDGRMQEVLTIEYADGAKLHVPVSQASLLSRYVGLSRHKTRLHRLGGRKWNRERSAAERAIIDMASTLLETQAHRQLLRGHAFPTDVPWQHEFEATFPYRETADQEEVITQVKSDMESARPMDRLICGDAGYGKTEVAMRAAFKTVMDHRQVAVLVPTTVLAQQHFETFSERMAPYPIRTDMLSRFCSQSLRKSVLRGMGEGTVDIVIGTHSLIQPGVGFRDLGLVIIDEEQRFGVAHKETFKQLRRLVDVLTLTATPIPRTLYMSMTGARDMSLLQTPPRERMAIETVVARNADKIVREAILREINREGQVFYLHNRVMTIGRVKRRLERLVPEARIDIAHGQMPSRELASVMHRFVAGEIDVLLCTTIIESGVDIPRANTILIDRADRFGLADLYQLRGRVGRSKHKAYAYMLLPPHGHVDSSARKRIGAIKRYSGLSVGFSLALRDLEIRGAGNMLGTEQSGHIAAIGFGLYCQLLRRTVAHIKGERPAPVVDSEVLLDFITTSVETASRDSSAAIPYDYIEDERLRVGVYRRIAGAADVRDLSGIRDEFADRFGLVPGPVDRLVKIAELRILASERQISRVETRSGKIMLTRNKDYIMRNKRFPRLEGSTVDEQLDHVIDFVRNLGA